MIQLLENKKHVILLKIFSINCYLYKKGLNLFIDKDLVERKKQYKKVLGWYVNRKFVSYWQIKKMIKKNK